jgi:putative salt-induced outer membrane protein
MCIWQGRFWRAHHKQALAVCAGREICLKMMVPFIYYKEILLKASHFSHLKISAVALSCLISTASFAADAPKTDGMWRGVGTAAFAITSGNTSSTSLLLNADTSRATEADKISLGAMANYARSKNNGDADSKTTSNKWGLFGQYDFNLTPELFAFGRVGFDSDKIIDLNLRSSLAGGLGYKVINTTDTTFTVFGGLGYTLDKYSVNQTVGNKTDSRFSRTSLYLGEESTHVLSSTVSFKQRLDLFPGLSGDKAFLAKFNAGLAVAMSSTMSLSVGVTDAYNSKPPVGVKKNDLGIFTGVNVKFGAP